MTTVWRFSGGAISESGTEVSLATFEGICHICKQRGHKAANCPKKRQGRGRGGRRGTKEKIEKFEGTCNLCGRYGHKDTDCWDRDENASKRPPGWKKRSETGAGATDGAGTAGDGGGIEFCIPSLVIQGTTMI